LGGSDEGPGAGGQQAPTGTQQTAGQADIWVNLYEGLGGAHYLLYELKSDILRALIA